MIFGPPLPGPGHDRAPFGAFPADLRPSSAVMPSLVPSIHVGPTAHLLEHRPQPNHVDGRDKPGHDGAKGRDRCAEPALPLVFFILTIARKK